MKTTIKEITPNEAMQLLERPARRPMNPYKVDYFVHLIRTGNFVFSTYGMCLGVGGSLIDGQNRLRACVITNTPIVVMMSVDAMEESAGAVDLWEPTNNLFRWRP